MVNKDIIYWIKKLNLNIHPEGGYFRQTYRSEEINTEQLRPGRFNGLRPISTAIYYLLGGDQFSAFHRLKSDEIWHFYTGHSLTIHVLDMDGQYLSIKLGNDPDQGEVFQAIIKADHWFGAKVNNNNPIAYSLVGCTVSPGFDFRDFEIGERAKLIELYPSHRSIIEELTLPFNP